MVKVNSKVLLEHLESINLDEPEDIKDDSYYEHMNHQILNGDYDQ